MDKQSLTMINAETGEVIENVRKIITDNQDTFFNKKRKMTKENKEFVDKYGEFLFKQDSKRVEKIEKKISDSDIAKLFYCATYLDYDNSLRYDNGKPISKKDLKELIGVNDRIFYTWYNLMISKKLLIECNGNILMNENYCIKGKLSSNKEYNRVFIRGIRYLYTENKGKNVKFMGTAMRMLPYANYKTCVLCWNPNERNIDKIKPMTVNELMSEFGYYIGNANKFINMFKDIRIHDGQPIMLFFNDNAYTSENYVLFNPLLTYSGNNEDLPEFYKLFVMLANRENSKKDTKNGINASNTKGLSARKKGQ